QRAACTAHATRPCHPVDTQPPHCAILGDDRVRRRRAPVVVGAEALDERVSLDPLPVLATCTRVNKPIALMHVFVPIPEGSDCRVEEVRPLEVESESVGLAIGASVRFGDGRHFQFVQLDPDSLESHDAFLIESSPAAHPASCRPEHIPEPANVGRRLVAKGRTLNGIRRSASEGEIEAWLDGYRSYPEQ
ncbi:MAG: hypothetical protein QF886_05195, partial [Planctomycetota bacterium]|nr:hypothetical protein [Planctomycetota bacterium]